ncbi:MAG: hypothetical protein REI09_00970 [Candidatus Dactylopiibacterium sp.]|nr:hypothetical protein [Candidatus Dactylopiibacterium sp.]
MQKRWPWMILVIWLGYSLLALAWLNRAGPDLCRGAPAEVWR